MPSLNLTITPIDTEKRKALDFRAGDTVRVWQKIKEADKTRLQAFEGIVLGRKHGAEAGATFTLRKVISGVGVEKIFPLYSPEIDKIEIKARAKFKRAKLYYVRERAARDIRKKMKSVRTGFIATKRAEVLARQSEEKTKQEEATK